MGPLPPFALGPTQLDKVHAKPGHTLSLFTCDTLVPPFARYTRSHVPDRRAKQPTRATGAGPGTSLAPAPQPPGLARRAYLELPVNCEVSGQGEAHALWGALTKEGCVRTGEQAGDPAPGGGWRDGRRHFWRYGSQKG